MARVKSGSQKWIRWGTYRGVNCKPLLHRIVTSDEKRIFYDNCKTSQNEVDATESAGYYLQTQNTLKKFGRLVQVLSTTTSWGMLKVYCQGLEKVMNKLEVKITVKMNKRKR